VIKKLKRTFSIALIIQFLLNAAIFAEEIPLDYIGQSFYSKKLRVEWKLATNSLPATLHVFKIVEGNFSQTTISNLMQLGNFSETNRVWSSSTGEKIPKDILCFRNFNDRHSLAIAPANGTVDLYTPVFSTAMPEDVPDESRGFILATNILKQLEIPTDQLIKQDGHLRTWFYPGEMTCYPKGGEPITRRSHKGVEFRRMLDGIPSTVDQVHIDFETHEQITQLEIRWHGIEPSKSYPVASTEQIADWIKEGRARVQSLEVAGPGGRHLQPSDIKQITIVGITLEYSAASYFSSQSIDEVPMSRMYPYAVLQADAELNPDDHETIWLFCPITTGALSKVLRKTEQYGFAIYPSNLEEKRMQQGNNSELK
jgi:hypothetical protein